MKRKIPRNNRNDEKEAISEIINKFKQKWKDEASNIDTSFDSDGDYNYFNDIRILSNTLQTEISKCNNIYDKISNLCAATLVISGIYNEYLSHYLDDEINDNQYQFEMDKWKEIINADISFDDKLFCLKIAKQFFDELDYYQEIKNNHCFVPSCDCCGYMSEPPNIYLLDTIKCNNIDELVMKYTLWPNTKNIKLTNDNHEDLYCLLRNFFHSNFHSCNKPDLLYLCNNNKLHLFIEFIGKIKIFEKLQSYYEKMQFYADTSWFFAIHDCFNNLCIKLYKDNGMELEYIQQIYANYIQFIQKYFTKKEMEQWNFKPLDNYIMGILEKMPQFIDCKKIEYFMDITITLIDRIDKHKYSTKYLKYINFYKNIFGIDLIKQKLFHDDKCKNTLKCILLNECLLNCTFLQDFIEYFEISKLINNDVITLQISLETLKCIRNKDIIFINDNEIEKGPKPYQCDVCSRVQIPKLPNSQLNVDKYKNLKLKFSNAFIQYVSQIKIPSDNNINSEIQQLISMMGINANQFFFNSNDAVFIISGIMNKYIEKNTFRKCLVNTANIIANKCFNFWGDRYLSIDDKKQLQIDVDILNTIIT